MIIQKDVRYRISLVLKWERVFERILLLCHFYYQILLNIDGKDNMESFVESLYCKY